MNKVLLENTSHWNTTELILQKEIDSEAYNKYGLCAHEMVFRNIEHDILADYYLTAYDFIPRDYAQFVQDYIDGHLIVYNLLRVEDGTPIERVASFAIHKDTDLSDLQEDFNNCIVYNDFWTEDSEGKGVTHKDKFIKHLCLDLLRQAKKYLDEVTIKNIKESK